VLCQGSIRIDLQLNQLNRPGSEVRVKSKGNRRSLHCATPDFLWKLVALANIIRLSLKKGAYAVLSRAAWQQIRVRSGRDDNCVAGRNFALPERSAELQIPRLRSG
jgi:hypothetical protein